MILQKSDLGLIYSKKKENICINEKYENNYLF